jgi:hypothetical protein
MEWMHRANWGQGKEWAGQGKLAPGQKYTGQKDPPPKRKCVMLLFLLKIGPSYSNIKFFVTKSDCYN